MNGVYDLAELDLIAGAIVFALLGVVVLLAAAVELCQRVSRYLDDE